MRELGVGNPHGHRVFKRLPNLRKASKGTMAPEEVAARETQVAASKSNPT